jgi:uncharacterized protein YkwD
MQKLAGIGLATAFLSAVALAFPTGRAGATAVQDVRAMKALVNVTRAQHGLRALRFAPLLDRSALLKAAAIRRCGSFSHTPCGAPFRRTFQQVGYTSRMIGENIGWGTGDLGTPTSILNAWLGSPPHRANLLGGRWREAGVAVITAPSLFGASDVRIWVLQFGRR